MKVQSNNLSFKSRNCPIKPFTIETKHGPLYIAELAKKDQWKDAYFTINNVITSIPPYKYNPHLNFIDRLCGIITTKYGKSDRLRKKDGNSTILIAKDKQGKTRGTLTLESLKPIYDIKFGKHNLGIGFVRDFFIDSKYRNQGIGAIMLDSILRTTKGQFSDVLLIANNDAVSFYKRNGFEIVDDSTYAVRKIIYSAAEGNLEYSTAMSKSIDGKNSWIERAIKIFG